MTDTYKITGDVRLGLALISKRGILDSLLGFKARGWKEGALIFNMDLESDYNGFLTVVHGLSPFNGSFIGKAQRESNGKELVLKVYDLTVSDEQIADAVQEPVILNLG